MNELQKIQEERQRKANLPNTLSARAEILYTLYINLFTKDTGVRKQFRTVDELACLEQVWKVYNSQNQSKMENDDMIKITTMLLTMLENQGLILKEHMPLKEMEIVEYKITILGTKAVESFTNGEIEDMGSIHKLNYYAMGRFLGKAIFLRDRSKTMMETDYE
ncbi:MAG: hypothetical protein ACHQ1D_11980, partial [Nitrososphaerales archaeon]